MKVSELKQELDALSAEMHARFAQVDARFAQIDARFDQVEARIKEEGETTRRHFDVVADSLRTEIRSLWGSIAASQRSLDQNRSEHGTFTSVLDNHELRLKSLEHYRH